MYRGKCTLYSIVWFSRVGGQRREGRSRFARARCIPLLVLVSSASSSYSSCVRSLTQACPRGLLSFTSTSSLTLSLSLRFLCERHDDDDDNDDDDNELSRHVERPLLFIFRRSLLFFSSATRYFIITFIFYFIFFDISFDKSKN